MAVMTDIPASATTRAESLPTGCSVFTGQMLAVAGALDVAYGLAAVLGHSTVALTAAQATTLDLALWGWLPLAIGALLLLIGVGMWTGRTQPVRVALGLAVASAVVHAALMHAFPFWALLAIMLDLVIIDQLTTRWDQS
jgi:hypothetical protein